MVYSQLTIINNEGDSVFIHYFNFLIKLNVIIQLALIVYAGD
jgi:hypothetical protein